MKITNLDRWKIKERYIKYFFIVWSVELLKPQMSDKNPKTTKDR